MSLENIMVLEIWKVWLIVSFGIAFGCVCRIIMLCCFVVEDVGSALAQGEHKEVEENE